MTMLRLGLYACHIADLKPYDSILIVGTGIFGMSALMFARVYNAKNIIVVERDPHRAALAKTHGATHVIVDEIGNATDKVIELNGGKLLEAAIDATSWGGNIRHCQACVGNDGNIVVISDPPNTDNQILNWGTAHYRGQHIHGCYINMQMDWLKPQHVGSRQPLNQFYPWTLRECHEFIYEKMLSGEINVKDLIAKKVSPADAQEVYTELNEDGGRLLGVEYDWSLLQ